MAVLPGQTVRVDFIGTLDDGAQFSNSYIVGEPFEFTVGSGTMLKAFEDAVCKLSPGEEVSIRIPCEQAYGVYDESLIETVPAHRFPEAESLPIGQYIVMGSNQGDIRMRVLKIEDGLIYFDHNHELAGEALNFEIKLVEVVG